MDVLVPAEQMANLRMLLAIGFGICFAVLLFEVTAGLERRSRPALNLKDVPLPSEECKLHSRKLAECTRLGMHSPASDETDTEEGTDDSAG